MSKSEKVARVKLAQNKKFRRRWLTWVRMARYGANNFTRNAWLTTAATAVMTITLVIIFTTVMARSVLVSTVDELRQKVDYSIYLRSDVDNGEVNKAREKIEALPNVTSVRYINTDMARQAYIEQNKPSAEELQAISELKINPFFPSLRVVISDPSKTSELAGVVENDRDVQNVLNPDPKRQPSFTGEKKKVIETISSWARLAERGGIIASVLFIAISMLIIFNTIRMAIFNRKDEIEMMKLIGADKGFIRGPFVVEAVMYGFFAAIVATVLGYAMLVTIEPQLSSYGIAVSSTRDLAVAWSPLVLALMIFLGAMIGIISSRLAVRRYLKV